jgi:hypothetical protein
MLPMSLGEVEVVPAAAREVLLETTAAPPQAVGVAPLQTVILATAMAMAVVQVAAMEAVEEMVAREGWEQAVADAALVAPREHAPSILGAIPTWDASTSTPT